MKDLREEMKDGFSWLFIIGVFTLVGTCAADNGSEVRYLSDSIQRLERSVNDLRAAQDALMRTMEEMQ